MSPIKSESVERRRAQNLVAVRQDARAVTPSIRSFAQAIDRQRQGLERIPLLRAARPGLVELSRALDDAEVAALAFSLDDPQAEVRAFAEAARAVAVPVLRTDLLLEEFQVYESRAAGADAVLLEVAVLGPELCARLFQAAASTHLIACLVCASEAEVRLAVSLQAKVLVLAPGLPQPPRTLLLAPGPWHPALVGRADAVLDAQLGEEPDPARAFRAALTEES